MAALAAFRWILRERGYLLKARRDRISLAQKLRWAARKGPSASTATRTPSAPKRHISEEGMQRIIAAAKKRWARHRAEQVKAKRESVKTSEGRLRLSER